MKPSFLWNLKSVACPNQGLENELITTKLKTSELSVVGLMK
ncbi:hypothetical protein [Metallosphaera hakonensis]|nr:hypothetical protein [Metallosphaera hakonensis]